MFTLYSLYIDKFDQELYWIYKLPWSGFFQYKLLELSTLEMLQKSNQNNLVSALASFLKTSYQNYHGAIVAMIVWLLDLQLPMQSVPITTDVVSLNPS